MNILEKALNCKIDRRSFLKWSGATGGVLAASGLLTSGLQQVDASEAKPEKIVPTSCGRSQCSYACVIRAVVKDGVIVRFETDEKQPDSLADPQLRACVKGRSFRKHIYSPMRIKYPMKRLNWAPGGGKKELRGRDQWVRISWDEAAGLIADEMARIKAAHGPQAFHDFGQSGRLVSSIHGRRWVQRLYNMYLGGFTSSIGSYSWPTIGKAQQFVFGEGNTAHDEWTLEDSNYIIMWSDNAYTTGGVGNIVEYMWRARYLRGVKIVSIDPWLSHTGQLANEWIPILPQTDEAMMLAMLWVFFTEYSAHIDQPWIEARSIGVFPRTGAGTPTDPVIPADECLKYYVLGLDGEGKPAPAGHKNFPAKTPEWAAGETGVPAEKIRQIAREFADNSRFTNPTKVAAITHGAGGGMNRRIFGENAYRLVAAIQVVTKNIGLKGGSAIWWGIPPANPIGTVPIERNTLANTHNFEVGMRTRAFLRKPVRIEAGPDMYKRWWTPDIRFVWVTTGNILNQNNDINQTLQAYRNFDCIVVGDPVFTVTCQFADIVLPIATAQEGYDIGGLGSHPFHRVFFDKCIEPLYEAKTDREACQLVAAKLGIKEEAFFPWKTDENLLKTVIWTPAAVSWSGLTYEQFKAAGIAKNTAARMARQANPVVYRSAFIAAPNPPVNGPPTPSRRIEIYSQEVKGLIDGGFVNRDLVRPIPTYPPRVEAKGDPILLKYPLANIQNAAGKRLHSTNADDFVPWMKDVAPEESSIIMNPIDAEARGIKTGDKIRIWNDRGEVTGLTAYVTARIAKGATVFFRGTQYRPKDPGVIGSVSEGGGPSVLTRVDYPETYPQKDGYPGYLLQGTPSGSCAVEIAKM